MMARTVRLSKSALCTAVLILGFLMPMAASAETTITFWYWAWANMDRTVDRLVEVFEAASRH
jgi:ABC-type glycerol-3-phosphate transport system substrate-binding protein